MASFYKFNTENPVMNNALEQAQMQGEYLHQHAVSMVNDGIDNSRPLNNASVQSAYNRDQGPSRSQ